MFQGAGKRDMRRGRKILPSPPLHQPDSLIFSTLQSTHQATLVQLNQRLARIRSCSAHICHRGMQKTACEPASFQNPGSHSALPSWTKYEVHRLTPFSPWTHSTLSEKYTKTERKKKKKLEQYLAYEYINETSVLKKPQAFFCFVFMAVLHSLKDLGFWDWTLATAVKAQNPNHCGSPRNSHRHSYFHSHSMKKMKGHTGCERVGIPQLPISENKLVWPSGLPSLTPGGHHKPFNSPVGVVLQ